MVHPNLKQFIVVTSFGARLFFVTRLTTVTTFYLAAGTKWKWFFLFQTFCSQKEVKMQDKVIDKLIPLLAGNGRACLALCLHRELG